jgi:hypothetical protein
MVRTNAIHSDGWMDDDGGVGAVSGGQGVTQAGRTCRHHQGRAQCVSVLATSATVLVCLSDSRALNWTTRAHA